MLRVSWGEGVEAVVVGVQNGCVGFHLCDGLPKLLPNGAAPNRTGGQKTGGNEQRSIGVHGPETRLVYTGRSTAIASVIPAESLAHDTPYSS